MRNRDNHSNCTAQIRSLEQLVSEHEQVINLLLAELTEIRERMPRPTYIEVTSEEWAKWHDVL